MKIPGGRATAIGLSGVLAASVLLPLGVAAPSSAATAGSGPTKSERIKVLTKALNFMRKDYKKLLQDEPGPADVFDYQVGDLWKRGIDGTGTTVAVIEGWDDPAIGSFMAAEDKALDLPKAQISTIYPTGRHKLPAKCPPGMIKLGDYGSCSGWAGELSLDVLSVHIMAPYARILITVAPPDSEITDDAASQVAPPEFMQAVEYVTLHHLANVISISDGTAESTYSHGHEEIYAQDPGELTAAEFGVPILVGTGDCDAVQHLAVGPGDCDQKLVTKTRATAAWDDSPWVTAVGGTTPNLSDTGQRLGPDPVWNFGPFGVNFGEGAGFSSVFTRPDYQNRVESITHSKWRSVPDISMDAADGTSEAGPLLAGVLALATQLNHGNNVGPINDVLYNVLGPAGRKDGIADVVSGNNDVIRNGKVAVRGFSAAKGFDVASGWGTILASAFVPALVSATKAASEDTAVRAQAAIALAELEHRVQLTRHDVSPGGSATLSAEGFLPGHPVALSIDGRQVAVLHAHPDGSVSYVIRPASLGLHSAQHEIKLSSMLLVATDTFRVS
jgi:subtilase family serine protease